MLSAVPNYCFRRTTVVDSAESAHLSWVSLYLPTLTTRLCLHIKAHIMSHEERSSYSYSPLGVLLLSITTRLYSKCVVTPSPMCRRKAMHSAEQVTHAKWSEGFAMNDTYGMEGVFYV